MVRLEPSKFAQTSIPNDVIREYLKTHTTIEAGQHFNLHPSQISRRARDLSGVKRLTRQVGDRRKNTEHRKAYHKQWKKDNPERNKAHMVKANQKRAKERWFYNLKAQYGLSAIDYFIMLEKQGYQCAICKDWFCFRGKKMGGCVDHDHKTGAIRGLLCNHCNSILGYARDKTSILESAIRYLTDYSPCTR